ncbi:MAG: HAD family hydrolase [Gammaproteobacteria bacterium]
MLLCFDYDGVIVDSIDALTDIAAAAQMELGLGRVPAVEDFRRIEELTFSAFATRIGIPTEMRANFAEAVMRLQQEMVPQDSGAFPGIVEALSGLASHHALVIITASHGAAVKRRLAELGVSECVSAIYGAEHGGPKHERIARAMAKFGYQETDTWMIGDAISDVRAGRIANVHTAAVLWGYQYRELLEAEQPDVVLRDVDELVQLFVRDQ